MSPQSSEHLNIARRFLDARVEEGNGARTAIVSGDRTLSYAQVQTLANRFANVLARLGVEREHRVIVSLPDTPEYVGALFGVLKLGAVVVMVNPGLDEDQLRWFFSYSRARAAVVPAERQDVFAAASAGSPLSRGLLVVGDNAGAHTGFPGACRDGDDTFTTVTTHRDDPALWLFSGGTTGHPKGVVQPHRSFAFTEEAYGRGVLGYTAHDITLSVPKLYFGYATGSNLFFPFAAGATAVLFAERPTPERLFRLIARHRPTILVNVPTMIQRMLTTEGAAQADLSSLRAVTSAGEALPAALHQRWQETFGVELLDGLGTAEQWHIFISNRPGDVKPGTLGTAVPGFDVRLCDAGGKDVPEGEIGALWVRGGARATGYWQLPERTARVFRGAWVVTGDMLSRRADGAYTYCGRGDEMLKVAGRWLSPGEVEGRLLAHAAVEACCVVGATDAAGLVKPCAFVVASGLGPEGEETLRAFCGETLARYKVPRRVSIVADLPRTHLGKVDRGALGARAEALLREAAEA
jgi:benzoate-CoA ligase family protein